MLKIGLTGGIGSGKSTVARIFEAMGVPVYFADEASKRLMKENKEIREAIIHHFGKESYINDKLNRSYIASIVFNDKEKLELLNFITHPATIKDANEWMGRQTSPYIIKEAALLFESGSSEFLDQIIGVYTPASLRIMRIMQRDGISKDEVIKRMDRQIEEEIKMKLCDFVIVNDEQELVIPQVMKLHEQFIKQSQRSEPKTDI